MSSVGIFLSHSRLSLVCGVRGMFLEVDYLGSIFGFFVSYESGRVF